MTTEEITKHLSDTLHTVMNQSSIIIEKDGLINIKCYINSINGVINDLSKSNMLLIDRFLLDDIIYDIYLIDLTNLKNISI